MMQIEGIAGVHAGAGALPTGRLERILVLAAALPLWMAAIGCTNSESASRPTPTTTPTTRASDARRHYPLDTLPTATIGVAGHPFRVWLARDPDPLHPADPHGIVQEGLMFVPTSEIADDQGMLFVFSDEEVRGFWMKNTIAPLDIAFARMNGTIVKIWQMPVLTLETFSSIEPAMFALEVKQGTFAALGIHEGDTLDIPAAVSGIPVP